MREAEFKTWFQAQGLSINTISTQVSKVRKLDRYFGDLDELHRKKQFDRLEAALKSDDPIAELGNDGERRHLPTSLRYYRKFLEGVGGSPAASLGLTPSDILSAIERCDATGSVDAFIASHEGLGNPRKFWLLNSGKRYPSKAIVRDALAHVGSDALPGGGQCKTALDALGFVVIDWPAFQTLRQTFLSRMAEFENFRRQDGDYWTIERRYKNNVIDKVQKIAASLADERAAGEQIYRALSVEVQGSPLSWRTLDEVQKCNAVLRDKFYAIVAQMARSGDDPVTAISSGAKALERLKADGITGLRRGEVLAIAISVVGTVHPEAATWFKISRIELMGKKLFDRKLFAHNDFTASDLDEFLQTVRALSALFDEELSWAPADLFDVQGFVWVALEDTWGDEKAVHIDDNGTITLNTVKAENPMATNLILFGPPGTGKTYHAAAEAVRLCAERVPSDREELMAAYHRLADAGRIEFVTFHQSVAYEDFVEGLRPTQTADTGAAGFELTPEPGVFRRIARRAETSTGPGHATFSIAGRKVFKMSIGEAANPDDAYLFEEAIDGGYTLLGFEDIDWSDSRFADRDAIIDAVRDKGTQDGEPNAMSGRVQMPFIFRNWVRHGDVVVVSKGNGLFRAIGEVVGDYQFVPREGGDYGHRRAVRWLWVDRAGVPASEIYARNFSQKSIYVLTEDELNMPALVRYISSQQGAGSGAPEPFVLVIDEINRANISKVFGELITLMEPDKRIGQQNALKVRLPYSGDVFGVPANLHIIGTMNTADRSIALLDTALRRRFEFRELMPDPSLLGIVDGIDVGALLVTINERIEYLFDREHQIGHAYFIRCATRSNLDDVMRHKIIPLLAEYFYDDWAKVAAVLGDGDEGEGDREGSFIDRRRLKAPKGLSGDEDATPRYRWSVRDAFAYNGFASA